MFYLNVGSKHNLVDLPEKVRRLNEIKAVDVEDPALQWRKPFSSDDDVRAGTWSDLDVNRLPPAGGQVVSLSSVCLPMP